ncbi:glycosyltransferase family 2 protein [Dinoroseobacter sp. S124A]|uniref:glycosyltransferase family 2 protein n=1 Tax=Dinoroseobacter sp. S124A TaxID=3415128 RepID=UPI003C7D8DA8
MIPEASVVIVSRGRGPQLARCLQALSFQTCPAFEVIVVGDTAARRAVADGPGAPAVTYVPFAEANVSAARNAGIALARAPYVAFLDDDAVAEPCWLEQLLKALRVPGVVLAAGYVRGPDGVRFQWQGEWLTAEGTSHPMTPWPEEIAIIAPRSGRVPGAMGTNFAVLRQAVRRMGGFDPRLRYFLDESDLVWRLVQGDGQVAYAPQAQVIHALAPGPYRQQDRTPRDLFEIGRSAAIFAQTHASHGPAAAVRTHRKVQQTRLLKRMVSGRFYPDEVWRLLRSFDRGAAEGLALTEGQAGPKKMQDLNAAPEHKPATRLFKARRKTDPNLNPLWTTSPRFEMPGAFARAAKQAEKGRVVTLVTSANRRAPARVVFRAPGVWIHELPDSIWQSASSRRISDGVYKDYMGIRIKDAPTSKDDGTELDTD